MIRVVLWKVDAKNCPAVMSKITNSPVTSVLRCISATSTRLHYYVVFVVVPTTVPKDCVSSYSQ